MACKIKKGDEVIVLVGKSKGHKGKIMRIDRKKDRVVVEGANVCIRHRKPSADHPEGGRIAQAFPVHISNVAIVDEASGRPTRVGFRFLESGKKVRYAKKSGAQIEEKR